MAPSCGCGSVSTPARRTRQRTITTALRSTKPRGCEGSRTAARRSCRTLLPLSLGRLYRATAHLKSLGHHRLRDFPKLEEIFQATIPGVDEVFPPLRTGESGGPAMMAIAVVDVCDSSDRVRGEPQRRHHRVAATARRRLAGGGRAAGASGPQAHRRRVLRRLRGPRRCAGVSARHADRGLGDGVGGPFRNPRYGRVELYDGDAVGPAAFVASELCKPSDGRSDPRLEERR